MGANAHNIEENPRALTTAIKQGENNACGFENPSTAVLAALWLPHANIFLFFKF
jgi:hypothetical protein